MDWRETEVKICSVLRRIRKEGVRPHMYKFKGKNDGLHAPTKHKGNINQIGKRQNLQTGRSYGQHHRVPASRSRDLGMTRYSDSRVATTPIHSVVLDWIDSRCTVLSITEQTSILEQGPVITEYLHPGITTPRAGVSEHDKWSS